MQRFIRNESLNRNVAVLGFTSAVSTFSISLWQGYLSVFLQGRFPSVLVIGGSFSMYGFVTAVAYLVAGPLGDSYGRKKVIVLSTYLLALCPLLLLFPNNAVLMAAPVLLYWAQTSLQPNFRAIITDSTQPAFRGAAIGIFNSLAVSISAVALLISGFALSANGDGFSPASFAPIFLFSGIMILGVAVARHILLKETFSPKTAGRERFVANVKKNIEPLRRRDLRIPTAAYMLHDAALSLVLFLVPIYAYKEVSMTPWMIGSMLAAQTILYFVLQVPFGRFADLKGRTWVIALSFGLEAFFAAAFVLYRNPLYVGLTYVAWMGLGQMDAPAQVALLADLSTIEERATVMGSFGGLTTLAAIPAPLLGGFLYGLEIPSPFYLCSALLFVSTLLVLLYRLRAR
ncbi:MAG TPA: MFS transporter [Conexivisphaerales archaeon]|nr:MFS transporter [Conexivisphaerales archaeon]